MSDPFPQSRARAFGRRMGAKFPRATRATMTAMEWIMGAVATVLRIALWGFGIFIVIYALLVLNWAPLWLRLYSACMSQQSDANTVSDIFRHRIDCSKVATKVIEKQP